MVKFLDISEDDVQTMEFSTEELDILLKAHDILMRKKLTIKKKSDIITGS